MSVSVLVFVEHAGGEPDRLSLEALTFALDLASKVQAKVDAVVLGAASQDVAEMLGPYGVGLAHVAIDPAIVCNLRDLISISFR